MEVLFETTKWALTTVDVVFASLFLGVIISSFILLISDDMKWTIATFAITFVVGMFGFNYINTTNPITEYTVKITEDSGYKTLLEDYEIIEQKSDAVFVVKEKK